MFSILFNFISHVSCCESHICNRTKDTHDLKTPDIFNAILQQIDKMFGMSENTNTSDSQQYIQQDIPEPVERSEWNKNNIPNRKDKTIIDRRKLCYMTDIETKYDKTSYQIDLDKPIYINKYQHKESNNIIIMIEFDEILMAICYTKNGTKRTVFVYENGQNPVYYTKNLDEKYDLNNNGYAKQEVLKGFHKHVSKNNKENLKLHAIQLLKENKINEASYLLDQIK